MNLLKSQKLLLIVPHFKVFIRDQAISIRPYLNNMTVLMPIPYFSGLVFKLPYIKKHFGFLEFAEESRNELAQDYSLVSPKFFTLPIEASRKRNCYLATQCCIKALSKNAINFSLVHAHFLGSGFIGAALKSLSGTPLVVTAHGGDVYNLPFRNSWYNTLARYILGEADQVITVCQFNAEKLLSLGVSSNKLHVIPNGYDENLFKPLSLHKAREKLGLPPNKKILLSVGNLVHVKGHTYLLDAMHAVLKKRNDVILVIVGLGSLERMLRKKAEKLSLKDKILLAGMKRHEEIPLWMNACNFFILPSLSEGFPTVIPEAFACGKPVVATRVGGVPEAISNADVGILVNPEDPGALTSAILKALDRKWRSAVILNHAKKYCWSHLTEQILSVYRNALG